MRPDQTVTCTLITTLSSSKENEIWQKTDKNGGRLFHCFIDFFKFGGGRACYARCTDKIRLFCVTIGLTRKKTDDLMQCIVQISKFVLYDYYSHGIFLIFYIILVLQELILVNSLKLFIRSSSNKYITVDN